MATFSQEHQIVNCLVPLADYQNGNPASDIVSMAECDHGVFILYTGANATGDAVITVESCDTVVPGTATAIAFRLTKYETSGSDVASTANAAVASTGFTTSTTANVFYVIEVDAADLYSTDKYVRIQVTEDTNQAVAGGAIFIGQKTRYKEATMDTAIV